MSFLRLPSPTGPCAYGDAFAQAVNGSAGEQGEGGGGGGGVRAFPAGVLEITGTNTRFLPFLDPKWLAVAFTAGAMLGTLVRIRRRS